jgi:hypothetical protein
LLPLHSAIAESGFAALGVTTSCPAATEDLPVSAVMCLDLLQRFAAVCDGRRDQGRVHPVAVVFVVCAVVGRGSLPVIAGWAADVSAGLLAQLYGRVAAPPSKATIWRVITGADAVGVDAVIGAWLAGQVTARQAVHGCEGDSSELVAIAVDGKTVRGAAWPAWSAWSANTGASSRCSGCATPSTARTTPPSAPDQDPAGWPL